MKNILGASVLLAGAAVYSTAALAAGMSAPLVYDWSGFYAGAQAGYSFGKSDIHDNSISTGNTDYRGTFSVDGIVGGVHAGYNLQRNMLVLGLETDLEVSGINGNNPNWPFGDRSKAGIDFQGSMRLRAGLAFDRALLYATGGLALGDITAKFYDSTTTPPTDSFSGLKPGWTIGGGIEYAVTDMWSVRAEYRYTEFYGMRGNTTNTDPGWTETNKLHDQTVRVGVSYHF